MNSYTYKKFAFVVTLILCSSNCNAQDPIRSITRFVDSFNSHRPTTRPIIKTDSLETVYRTGAYDVDEDRYVDQTQVVKFKYVNNKMTNFWLYGVTPSDNRRSMFVLTNNTSTNTHKTLEVDSEEMLKRFIDILECCKTKYAEWATTAQEKKIRSYEKEIPVDSNTYPMFYATYNMWNRIYFIQKTIEYKPFFRVNEVGTCILEIRGMGDGKKNVDAYSYKYATSTFGGTTKRILDKVDWAVDGFGSIKFSNVEQIESLITALKMGLDYPKSK